MDNKVEPVFFGGFIATCIWIVVLFLYSGISNISTVSQSEKNDIILYIEKFPELSNMRREAYEKNNNCLLYNDYYKIRHKFNFLMEIRDNEQSLPNKK